MQAAFWVTVGLLCLTTAGLGNAQKPQPCRSPPLFMGGLTVGTQNEKVWAVGRYAYDAVQQRIHLGEMGTYNNKSFTYNALMLFDEGVLYEINHKEQTCVKKPLQSDFHPMAVPKGATFISQVVLGTSSAPGQGLLVNNWWGDMPDKQGNYILTFSEFGCFPVSALAKTKEFGWMSVSYYDNVLGAEPHWFIPPPFCADAELVESEDGKVTDFFSVFH
ncbi:ependymin-1-like [Engraulis encrasicolus]|uniref:ependymin-1-like n=1 Tax=Engraulis encrasicolus TaxID=184585 RepID=UPI002FCFAE69